MKLEYTVVHSEDKWLLARLVTDLQMSGISTSDWSCDEFSNPFTNGFNWVAIYSDGILGVNNHPCLFNPIRHELTSRNYIEVLTKILGQ